ncbi:hypothetical protein FA13DRAFT_1819523 [Coprinellus micaceus]|uniref:Uncharacterized protein n=1 Tax=Coprinellus micaceus TaxID=71717 RepID=A0A4Y7SIR3_COPMI|nr:hypothetical protein FA13DRAFT_1819523 [Coprinellus micaceus]
MPGPSNSKRKKKGNPKSKNKSKRPATESDGTAPGVGGGGAKPAAILTKGPSVQQAQASTPMTKPESSTSLVHTKSQSHSSLSPLDAVIQSHPQDQLLSELLPSPYPPIDSTFSNLGITSSASSSDLSYPPSPLLTPEPPSFINLLDPSCSSTYVESFYESYIRKNPSTERIVPEERLVEIEQVLQKPSFIHDPGNGPRVRDIGEFLKSEFFAQPPSHDDSLCAEFAQPEVLQMLQTVLPSESAMILWYNKSRSSSRVCPSCQRLYRLGDILPEIILGHAGEKRDPERPPHPQLSQEQKISGLCSPVCFVLASFLFQEAIKGAWGKMAEDIDDETWDLLNSPTCDLKSLLHASMHESLPTSDTKPRSKHDTSAALGMMVRMTRLHDLGLAQLLFGRDDDDEDEEEDSGGEEALDGELDWEGEGKEAIEAAEVRIPVREAPRGPRPPGSASAASVELGVRS